MPSYPRALPLFLGTSFGPASNAFVDDVTPPVPGPVFCDPVELNLFYNPVAQNAFLSGTNNLTVETVSLGTTDDPVIAYATETFIAADNEVKIETKIIKNTTTGVGIQFVGLAFFSDFPSGPGGPNIYAGVYYGPHFAGGALLDITTGSPIATGMGNIPDYEMALYIDPTTNPPTARFKDSASTTLTEQPKAIDFGYQELQMVAIASAAAETGAELDIVCNFGSSAFSLGDDATTWCLPSNQPVLCDPVTWIINQGLPGADQLITQGGADNLTITAECNQSVNAVAQSGVAANQLIPAGITEEVKIEAQITTVPPTATTHVATISIGFFHDIDTTPLLLATVAWVPQVGIMIGTLGGTIGGPGSYPFADPTDLAVYFNPNPQKKVHVFQVNSGLTGTITVHGVTTNVDAGFTQELIASNIVGNGFTDVLNIESIVLGGNYGSTDIRDVIITYTESAGDFPVDVTQTGGLSIFDNTSNSKPFALQTARVKFLNTFSDTEFDIPAINYDPLKPIYMASGINSGDVIGGQFITTYNFGSSDFILAEDARRWCNL